MPPYVTDEELELFDQSICVSRYIAAELQELDDEQQ